MTETQPLDLEPGHANPPGAARAQSQSVLFAEYDVALASEEPDFFGDLNLDQVVDAVVAGRDEYELRQFFYTPLRAPEGVEYRHEMFRDLEKPDVRAAVKTFAEAMQQVRRYLTLVEKQHYRYEKERWFLDAAHVYGDAVAALHEALRGCELDSRGMTGWCDHLAHYTSSVRFTSLIGDSREVVAGLGRVRYTVRIKGARVTVSTYEDEPDYSVEVEEAFARFRQGEVETHLVKIPDSGSMDHVEARIAQLVARIYPREFQALDELGERHRGFLDSNVARFDREVQFYLAWLEHSERLMAAGLDFCYPTVSTSSKEISVEDGFDIALATRLRADGQPVVRNDFVLRGPERVLVVTGPNQGGKTTFARMVAQLHYLASLGLPIPARRARLFLPDRVFTHFEREEDIRTLRGKLDDELVRIREILDQATGDSVVTLNETFASTTLSDALFLGTEVLKRLTERGCLAVWVTFVDELSSLNEATVSMVATVAADDPSQRTFKIVRKPADGRAYAWALADKYGLSYERLRDRVRE
jgi:DNA mismatch repair protein MutS